MSAYVHTCTVKEPDGDIDWAWLNRSVRDKDYDGVFDGDEGKFGHRFKGIAGLGVWAGIGHRFKGIAGLGGRAELGIDV